MVEFLYATAHLAGDFSSAENAVGDTPGTWAGVLNENTNYTSRWAMGNPVDPLTDAATQTFRIVARKGTNTGDPTITINLYENGTITYQGSATLITSTTGQTVTVTFNTADITNPDNVEIEVVQVSAGGSPSDRNSAQISHIEWEADTTAVASGVDHVETLTDPVGSLDSVVDESTTGGGGGGGGSGGGGFAALATEDSGLLILAGGKSATTWTNEGSAGGDGSVVGASLVTGGGPGPGMPDAYSADGVDDWISVAQDAAHHLTGDFTLIFVLKNMDGAQTDNRFYAGFDRNTYWHVRTISGTGVRCETFSTGGTRYRRDFVAGTMPEGTWRILTFRVSASGADIYYTVWATDGTEIGEEWVPASSLGAPTNGIGIFADGVGASWGTSDFAAMAILPSMLSDARVVEYINSLQESSEPVGTDYTEDASDGIGITDSLSVEISRSIQEVLTDTLPVADDSSSALTGLRELSDDVGIVDSTREDAANSVELTDGIGTVDSTQEAIGNSVEIADDIGTADSVQEDVANSVDIADDESIGDALETASTYERGIVNGVTSTDAIDVQKAGAREDTQLETVAISDSIEVVVTVERGILDSIGLDDTLEEKLHAYLGITESIGISDSIAADHVVAGFDLVAITVDGIGITDEGDWLHRQQAYEEIGLTDSIEPILTEIDEYPVEDAVGLSDSIEVQLSTSRDITDDVSTSDDGAWTQHGDIASDNVNISDTVTSQTTAGTGSIETTISDGLSIIDTSEDYSLIVYLRDTVTNSIVITDSVDYELVQGVGAEESKTDNVGLSDSVLTDKTTDTTATDAVGVSDSITVEVSEDTFTSVDDSVTVTDSINVIKSTPGQELVDLSATALAPVMLTVGAGEPAKRLPTATGPATYDILVTIGPSTREITANEPGIVDHANDITTIDPSSLGPKTKEHAGEPRIK